MNEQNFGNTSYLLRICAVVSTPPTEVSRRQIIELASLDLEFDGERAEIGNVKTWLFMPKMGPLPAAEEIAGLTAVDLASYCIATTSRVREILLATREPDVLVAHGVSSLRMIIPDFATKPVPWICAHKAALQLWPGASGYTLDELISWRGIKPTSQNDFLSNQERAGAKATMTGLLVRDLLQSATINQLLFLSAIITCPLGPPPLASNYPGWLSVPDDDLHWYAHHATNLPSYVREEAQREIKRRELYEDFKPLRFNPPRLPRNT